MPNFKIYSFGWKFTDGVLRQYGWYSRNSSDGQIALGTNHFVDRIF